MKKSHKNTICLVVAVLSICLSAFTYNAALKARNLKADLVHLSSIQYGLFNVDEWKTILTNLVTKKLDELEVTDENEADLRKDIQTLLYKLIDEAERNFNSSETGISGWFKRGVNNSFGVFAYVKRAVPEFTEDVLYYLKDPEKRKELAGFINEKIGQFADSTFSKMDYSERDAIIEKYAYPNKNATIAGLQLQLDAELERVKMPSVALLLGWFVAFIALALAKNPTRTSLLLLSIGILSVLLLGLGLPMIDIDARISSFRFQLLGEPIVFENQVLFFKSKSILEVVQLMLFQGKLDVLFVGILVLLFSVLFPLSKLISVNLYLFGKGRENKLVNFLAFKTGKWSMADVFVIAIFMAFIGFNGILGDQLGHIESIANNVEILTTNNSKLQPGFFFFSTFAIFGILLAQKVSAKNATL